MNNNMSGGESPYDIDDDYNNIHNTHIHSYGDADGDADADADGDGDSDEDTEDASEGKDQDDYESPPMKSDNHWDEPMEIKEQMYQDKLANLKKQLQQLKDGQHPEYGRRVRRLEQQLQERQRLNAIQRDCLTEWADLDYIAEKKAAAKEFEEKKVDLKENLLTDFEDKRKHIENERHNMELNGDSMEVKPAMTRKLRRRPNEPAPIPDKRRKHTATTLTYTLDDRDIESDLRQIARGRSTTSNTPRKHIYPSSPSTYSIGSNISENRAPSPLAEARIEDGKLLYERRWYHRGQSIFVEGKDCPRFAANITAIGSDSISVKKAAVDGNKWKIYTSQLARGKITIKRRAS